MDRQKRTPAVLLFTLPPLVRRLAPDDLDERITALQAEDCLLSFYGTRDQSLVMFRIDGTRVISWFAQGPLPRDAAIAIAQEKSVKECLPQSKNYFYLQ